MGKYKDETGNTRVGDFLRGLKDIGKPVLKVAGSLTGQEWLTKVADGIKTSKEMSEEEKKLAMELLALDVKDRDSARNLSIELNKSGYASWLSKNMPALLCIMLTIMVGFSVYWLFKFEVPEKNEAIIYSLMGTLGTAWLASIYYWVGSSDGSNKKTFLMSKK